MRVDIKFTQILSEGGILFALDTYGQVWRYGPPLQIGANTLSGQHSSSSWQQLPCFLELEPVMDKAGGPSRLPIPPFHFGENVLHTEPVRSAGASDEKNSTSAELQAKTKQSHVDPQGKRK